MSKTMWDEKTLKETNKSNKIINEVRSKIHLCRIRAGILKLWEKNLLENDIDFRDDLRKYFRYIKTNKAIKSYRIKYRGFGKFNIVITLINDISMKLKTNKTEEKINES